MNASSRDKILKSWSGISEVALIKEVATKGEYVDLCIEYWAKKRKMPLAEYKLFFHDVIQTYVSRLLTERLVCKAETVLRNVHRNVRYFYYQFACECKDEELRELIMEHLKRKDPSDFDQDMQELKFYWELLQELQRTPTLLERYKAELRRVNLETLLSHNEAYRKRLMVELYFENKNPVILAMLNKFVVWDFLVEHQNMHQLTRWCILNTLDTTAEITNDLDKLYKKWPIEAEMYKHALKALKEPSEGLRNFFAMKGYIFADESQQVTALLRRLCTTNSFEQNKEVLNKLPLGKYLLDRGYVMLLLRDFVSTRELEELAEVRPEQRKLLEFMVALKSNTLEKQEGFQRISAATKSYLESEGVDFETTQPLVTFFEYLSSNPSVSSLSSSIHSSALKHIPYLAGLARRLDNAASSTADDNLPTPYDMLLKFRQIDFKQIACKDSNEIASFSNERLCQKYGREYQINYLHYLNQHRSSYAVYYLIMDSLKQYGQISRNHLFSASETVTELALRNHDNQELLAHCIAFIEMLGFNTQNLRNFLKLCRLLDTKNTLPSYSQLIEQVEAKLVAKLEQPDSEFPLQDYQALMRIVACNQYRQWPELVLKHYAKANNWRMVLLLMQYFDIPIKQLQRLVPHFGERNIGENMLRALSYEPTVATTKERTAKRLHTSYTRQQARRSEPMPPITTSAETVNSSHSSLTDINAYFKSSHNNQARFLPDASGNLDLFAIILLSSNSIPEERITDAVRFRELMQDNHSYATSVNLMKNSIKFKLPVLSLLSAMVADINVDWNWVVYLAVATEQWSEVQAICVGDASQLAWTLIENCMRHEEIATLHRSMCIFYGDNPLTSFIHFLRETAYENNFGEDVINDLRFFLLAWSNDELKVPHAPLVTREQLMKRTIQLILLHLQVSFSSAYQQRKLLQCICESGISDITTLIDFCLLNQVFAIVQYSNVDRGEFPFDELLENDSKAVYEQLIHSLLEAKDYDRAIKLATLLHLPISDIVYVKWVAGLDSSSSLEDISFDSYEDEIREHSLPPELLVNFFLYAALRLEEPSARKYLLLKRALTVIKKNHLFPNESFDRDQIEYDMVMCYLQIENTEEVAQLELYYSEYFEEIMLKERCVLYKSFLELKELAGIDDLSASMKTELTMPMKLRLEVLLNRLLDEGDIVEDLRLQELFDHRPVDLRFVVFCMALAEGVTTIFSMSSEERERLREVEKSAFGKFNKRTFLTTLRSSGSHQDRSSPFNESSDSCSTLEFEEIPSKEKRETLETIQGIASRLKNGINIGTRILKAYRAAMYLDKEYLDVLRTKDISVLLKSVAEEGCLHKLMVVSDITTSTHMTAAEIAELLAFEITTAIVRPRFYIFVEPWMVNKLQNANLWGYDIDRDLHLFLELAPNTTLLGNWLLDYCDALKVYRKFQAGQEYERSDAFDKLSDIIERFGLPAEGVTTTIGATASNTPTLVLSHKKQNVITVELLIKAHECFVHECSMEGIANVLNRTKALNVILTQAKSWSLLVRMLIGIGRYREMYYCFDALIENEQFESLLGQFDKQKTVALRQGIKAYLREYSPANAREYLKLAALHFLMYKELAEMWEEDAQVLIKKMLALSLLGIGQLTEQDSMISLCGGGGVPTKVHIPKLSVSTELKTYLQEAMENYTHATENYLLDNKLLLAQRSASQAELMAMQIDLASRLQDKNPPVPVSVCVCVINVQTRDDFRELINSELIAPQALILSRAYGYDINWSEVLLSQYVILCKKSYLKQYLAHLTIRDSMVENIIKGFHLYAVKHKTTRQMEEHLEQLVHFVKSITLKYKLASILNMKSTVMELINGQTVHYLKDTDYGRNEIQDLPDV